ncbi:MAG: hypothetical protein KGL53_12990 [Elusimicrobia bacterium]|nr:hypothetical protein [Elusimicrobiota bacterium]
MVEAAGRMGRLIDGLLQLFQLAKTELEPGEADLSRLAEQAVEDLRGAEPGRAVEVSILPGLAARGDARLLGSLLANLLANAWKFTARTPRARVEFGAEGGEGERVFCVRDNGAGFDMRRAGRLFEPFHRLHAASDFPGNGIGLATARRIVARHGGRMWADSEPGRGASFYFTLPGPVA